MDATIKATSEEIVLRVGSGSMHIKRGTNPHFAVLTVFLRGGTALVTDHVAKDVIDALCVLVGEAHAGN